MVFRHKTETVINSDSASWLLKFNMNFFTNGPPRKQVHGYLDVFDQIKVLKYTERYSMKETDTLTNENTSCPRLYSSYDPDAQGRTVDSSNIVGLASCKYRFLHSDHWGGGVRYSIYGVRGAYSAPLGGLLSLLGCGGRGGPYSVYWGEGGHTLPSYFGGLLSLLGCGGRGGPYSVYWGEGGHTLPSYFGGLLSVLGCRGGGGTLLCLLR